MKTSLAIRSFILPLTCMLALSALPARADRDRDDHRGRLPEGFVEVRVGRDSFYECRGVFYRTGPHGYVRIAAPRGAVVRVLPARYSRIYVGGIVYYLAGGIYYTSMGNGFVVVDPPAAVVQAAPPVAAPVEPPQTVMVSGRPYIFQDGQFFIQTPEGLVWVQPPLGVVVSSLPADAKSIWFQRVEYFETDSSYYRRAPGGFMVVGAPWKR
ncbi:MAG: DUF6515 family protein [Opitutales bacterium]